MPKFRKKPVVVEATQWFKPGDHPEVVQLHQCSLSPMDHDCTMSNCTYPAHGVHTLEGFMIASPGDWIVTGVAGEHYPVKPAIFDKIYEPC